MDKSLISIKKQFPWPHGCQIFCPMDFDNRIPFCSEATVDCTVVIMTLGKLTRGFIDWYLFEPGSSLASSPPSIELLTKKGRFRHGVSVAASRASTFT